MHLRPIPPEGLSHWYENELTAAFPPNERKPLAEILRLAEEGRYEILGLFDGHALLGFATLMTCREHPGYVLLDYLAVSAAHRNGGLGSRILSLLEERCRGRFLVLTEAEAPVAGDPPEENALRLRRVAFYERCGFRPVYEMATCGARFQALVLGVPGSLPQLMAAHRAIYGPLRTDVQVPLSPGEVPRPPYWMKEGDRLDL